MPATTTFVSTTARCFRFLGFGCNGDLRHSPFLTVTANGALNLLFGDLPYIFGRVGERVQEFLLPSRSLPPAWHVAIEVRSAQALFNLVAKRSKRNSKFDGLLLGRETAREDHVLRILDAESLLGGTEDVNKLQKNVCSRPQGFLQAESHFRSEEGFSVKKIGTIHPLRLDHAKLHEILQFFRFNLQNRARLLQFQRSLCHIPSI